jgi:CO/xanthine dehydrogenase FAD-binding subunit
MGKAYRPLNILEALEIAEEHNALPLAGGTDLMVQHRSWSGLPPLIDRPVVFIGHLRELQEVALEQDALVIGAGCTLSSLLEDERMPALLREAVHSIGGPSIRSRATIGGNICNASPAADSLPALYVLGAEMMSTCRRGTADARGQRGGKGGAFLTSGECETRTIPIEAFIEGPGKTCLRRGELLTAVRIPVSEYNITFFKKVGTRASNALAKLSLAAVARTENAAVKDVRLALGAVAPTVARSTEAEELIRNKTPSEIRGELYRILEAYNRVLDPIDDQRSSSVYRLKASFRLILSFIGTVLLPDLEKKA